MADARNHVSIIFANIERLSPQHGQRKLTERALEKELLLKTLSP